jgi:hypothetical protein
MVIVLIVLLGSACFLVKRFLIRAWLISVIKEATIVWLAEQAGYDVVKRNGADSGKPKVVDGADVSVGGGEDPVGEAPTGGKPAAKRRSSRASKGK